MGRIERLRIIVASKPDLPELVESGKFKRDLFYRISKLPILIAPLRERRDDIAPLIAHFTNYYNDRDKTDKAFRSKTVRIMEQYDWPGNVRELDNVVCYMHKHCTGKFIEPNQLDPKFFKKLSNSQMTWEQFQARQFQDRREFLSKVFEGSTRKAHAAKQLGVFPHAIHALLKTYDITWENKTFEISGQKTVLR